VDIWIADGDTVLLPGGKSAQKMEEGAVWTDPTLSIPAEAMEALVAAIDRWQGQPSHAKTEAAVLREWLAKEQARVDKVFEAVGRPIVFDGPSR
jgi:hypothetical protein